jgi:hypothetical protein
MIEFKSNKKIIKYLIIIACAVLFNACGEDTNYYFEIGINNKTEYKLIVEVFPREEYLNNNLYNSSTGGRYSLIEFTLENTEYETIYGAHYKSLYTTRKLNNTPTALTQKIFDSIMITVNIGVDSTIMMKFREKGSINYKTNMYESDTNWVYEKIEGEHPDNFNRNPYIEHRYTFNIKTDFIEIQNK